MHDNTVSTPLNVILTQESSSIRVAWDHPCSGPPTTHYVISYIFVQTGTQFLTHTPLSATLPNTTTSTTFTDIDFPHGSTHIVVVTSVSHVETSKLAYIHIGIMFMHLMLNQPIIYMYIHPFF